MESLRRLEAGDWSHSGVWILESGVTQESGFWSLDSLRSHAGVWSLEFLPHPLENNFVAPPLLSFCYHFIIIVIILLSFCYHCYHFVIILLSLLSFRYHFVIILLSFCYQCYHFFLPHPFEKMLPHPFEKAREMRRGDFQNHRTLDVDQSDPQK